MSFHQCFDFMMHTIFSRKPASTNFTVFDMTQQELVSPLMYTNTPTCCNAQLILFQTIGRPT